MAELDSRFTFENFVVGPANRLASAAARRAAESPGSSYNPLFLYSASGLGKTHILGAIAHQVSKIHPDKSVVYQTLEGFLGELTKALEEGDRDGVRGEYESLEILLMDDVQFLTGQTEAQEMLLRTLDALAGEGKQVILASDRPPSDIDGLDARLRTRFEGGLLVDIGPPEYETRVAIVRRQAEARGQALDSEVADVIGRIPFKNIRELGGALNRILAIQELEERPVTPEEAAHLLGAGGVEEEPQASEAIGDFLEDLSHSVAAQVERQEAPWRKALREAAEVAEADGIKADRLRKLIDGDKPPTDLTLVLEDFRKTVARLNQIQAQLDAVGNPWPEAAHSVLKDPDRMDEAEALLASARERVKPFPAIGPGPGLDALGDSMPQLVLKAAEQLMTTDRPEYNPLYVWNKDGETAELLLGAVGRTYQAQKDGAKVAFISVAEFADEFIGALSAGVAGAWRERWWSAELLLVHGAEALSDTERAQDEFFHLFEALQRRKARVMVAADRPPSKIRAIDDRLRSRFEGGLVLEVEATAPVEDSSGPAQTRGGALPTPEPPALDEIVIDDSERGGLFPDPPASPPSTAKKQQGRREKKDVSDLDREWIMGFTVGDKVQLGREVSEAASSQEVAPDEPEETPLAGEWFPSPERVVWEWPRFEERMVEEPD